MVAIDGESLRLVDCCHMISRGERGDFSRTTAI